MDEQTSAQALGKRHIVESLDRAFARLHASSCEIVQNTTSDQLYARRKQMESIGESVLRSAAVVEQAFGGITANLWDDPFEWTLPEHLTTTAKVIEHLREVETIRARAFASFTDDSCLAKQIATPTQHSQTLIDLLLETLVKATTCQARATGKFVSRSDAGGFII